MYNLDYTWKLAASNSERRDTRATEEWRNRLQTRNERNSIRRNNNFCFYRSNSNNLTEVKLKVMLHGTIQTKLLLYSIKSLSKFVCKKFYVLDILKLRRMFRMAISKIKSKSCQDPGNIVSNVLSSNSVNSIKSVNSVNLFDYFNLFNPFNSISVHNSFRTYCWVPCLIQNRDEKATCETHDPKVENTVLQLLNHNRMSRPTTIVS